MAIRIKAKTYGPFTTAIGPGKVIHVDTAPKQTVAITSPSTEEAGTPVDFMISALGACLALSSAAESCRARPGAYCVPPPTQMR